MSSSLTFHYLIDPDDVRAVMPHFLGQPVIGLDTETFFDQGEHQNRLSLLQLASPNGRVVVIDGLAAGIEVVRPLIDNPDSILAAHNARFDEGVLRRNGFDPAGFVDTLSLSRRTLQLTSHSLASIADHLFGIKLDKSFQMSDWRRRPLSREQLYYAALDAVVALRLYQELAGRLEEDGRWEAEFRRARIPHPSETDLLEKRKKRRSRRPAITLRPLTGDERRLVDRLNLWRQKQAETERVPLYMICPDKTFEHLAIVRPRRLEDLVSIHGLGPTRIDRYGVQLLEIICG